MSETPQAETTSSVETTSVEATSVEPVETTPPLLRVVTGDPTAEELAALVTVVSALASAGTDATPKPRSEWAAPHRRVRGSHRHGAGAWRASAR